MATAVDRRQLADDIAIAPAAGGVSPVVHKRRGWIRRMYSPVEAHKETAADGDAAARKPRRGGWLRRQPRGVSGVASSRLLAGLPRWKRISVGGGWASALLDAAAFRVMYVVEAVVLGLALSCFFCCCGCQI